MADLDPVSLFPAWVVIEMMGHRQVAGRAEEVIVAGGGFLRLDTPDDTAPGGLSGTQLIAPASVYALHFVTEEAARAAARRLQPYNHYPLALAAGPANDEWGGQ